MTHRLMRFGTVDLPLCSPQFDAGTAPSRPGYVQTTSGTFDSWGTERSIAQYPYALPYRSEVVGSLLTTIRTSIDALRALRGKRQKLYRMMLSDDTFQWAYARLERIAAPREVRNVYYQGLELDFSVLTPWYTAHHGDGWFFDAGEYFDSGLMFDEDETHVMSSSPLLVTLSNQGTADVTDIVITVTAGDVDITSITFTLGDCETIFSGTISSGTSLVIDCGAMSVTNNGADAWADFNRTSNHVSKYWLVLMPGYNIVTTTFVGGSTNSVLEFDYWEAHE